MSVRYPKDEKVPPSCTGKGCTRFQIVSKMHAEDLDKLRKIISDREYRLELKFKENRQMRRDIKRLKTHIRLRNPGLSDAVWVWRATKTLVITPTARREILRKMLLNRAVLEGYKK